MSKNAQYKLQNIRSWNEIAPRYHRRWEREAGGPWRSSSKLVQLSRVGAGDAVLDVACGTGIVTRSLSSKVGKYGLVIGVDSSAVAIKIARRECRGASNLDFVNCDAERFSFSRKFDAITCQYALFFFPNARKALKNMARHLRDGGILGVSVHGNNTPYYTSIIDVVTKYIPDYLPRGPVRLDRFGTTAALKSVLSDAGFKGISISEFNFSFSPGTFEEYWANYRRYVSKQVREKLGRLSRSDQLDIRRQVREKTIQYTKRNRQIVFPWQVLISTARM